MGHCMNGSLLIKSDSHHGETIWNEVLARSIAKITVRRRLRSSWAESFDSDGRDSPLID